MLFGKYLNKLYLKYIYFFIIGIAALLVVDYAQLLIPEYLGDIIDMFGANSFMGNEDKVYELVRNVVFVAIILAIGRVSFRLSLSRASTNIEASLRERMFKKATMMSPDFYYDNKIGNIMNRFTTDVEEIERFLRWGIIMQVDAIFLSALALYKMFMVNSFLTLILLIPLTLIVIWGVFVEIFMKKKWRERQRAVDDLYYFAQESFTGIRVIKAFVKETAQIHRFAKIAKKNKDCEISFVRVSVGLDVMIELIINLIMVLLLGLGAWLIFLSSTGNPFRLFAQEMVITPGDLIKIVGYFSSLVWPMMALGQIFQFFSRAKASYKRISNFLDEEIVIIDSNDSVSLEKAKGKIEFSHFNFKFKNSDDYVLKDINLTINEGEHIGIVGRVGSGKSTLVTSLLHFYNVENGAIKIDDVDLMKIKLKDLRANISWARQDTLLFSDTISENIKFGRDFDEKACKSASKFADLDKDVVAFQNEYETVLGERGVTLSGGQRQRVAIARAFIRNTPILILDDSVSAVDTKTSETILKNIKNERSGKTTLIVASRVSTVVNLDKIVLLDEGRIIGFGTHDELLRTCKEYKKIVDLQKLEDEVNGEVNG